MNFQGKLPHDTYQSLVQLTQSAYVADGTGSLLRNLNITSSWTNNALTASNINFTPTSASYALTASGVVMAAGLNTQLQYNFSSSLTGDVNLTWNPNTKQFQISGSTTKSTLIVRGSGDGGNGTYGTIEGRGAQSNRLLWILGTTSTAESAGYLAIVGNSALDTNVASIDLANTNIGHADKRAATFASVNVGGDTHELQFINRISTNTLALAIKCNPANDTIVQGRLGVNTADPASNDAVLTLTRNGVNAYLMDLGDGDDSTTPNDSSTPAGWIHVRVGGGAAWMPYFI
jgi:hypothetical protein